MICNGDNCEVIDRSIFEFVFVNLYLYRRGYLEDSRSFDGDSNHLTLYHGYLCRSIG